MSLKTVSNEDNRIFNDYLAGKFKNNILSNKLTKYNMDLLIKTNSALDNYMTVYISAFVLIEILNKFRLGEFSKSLISTRNSLVKIAFSCKTLKMTLKKVGIQDRRLFIALNNKIENLDDKFIDRKQSILSMMNTLNLNTLNGAL